VVSGVHGIYCRVRTAPTSGRSLMSWMVGSRPLSVLKSRSQALISARRAAMSMTIGDDDQWLETDAEMKMGRSTRMRWSNAMAKASRRPSGSLSLL